MHLDPIRFRYRPDDIVGGRSSPRRIGAAAGKERKFEDAPKPLPEELPEEPGPRLAGKPKSKRPQQSPAEETATP